MKQVFFTLLKWGYWLSYPISAAVLHNSKRTRVLVQSGDEILLVRTSFGAQRWGLPGGGVKRSETNMQAALRELEEEAGVVIALDRLKDLGELKPSKQKRWPVARLHLFSARLDKKQKPKITRKLEIMAAEWHSANALPEPVSQTVIEALKLHDA